MLLTVIGGSGFIGTRLCKRLKSVGTNFVIVDKVTSVTFPDNTIVADVRNIDQLRTAIPLCECIINLTAEHRDDVKPKSLYYEVNVKGAENICQVANEKGIGRIIFTSSVAVYGFAPAGTDENGELRPFNEYGYTKMEAEKIFQKWQSEDKRRSLVIIRPTVVFGEQNKGNIYNLIKQIASNRFIMVGKGTNLKSMAYVENVTAFLEYCLSFGPGSHIYNYVDKPDFDMNTLVKEVYRIIGRSANIKFRLPYHVAYMVGKLFDLISWMSGKNFAISAIRIKKFCSNTMFNSSVASTGFISPVDLKEALEKTIRYEFLEKHDDIVFYSE